MPTYIVTATVWEDADEDGLISPGEAYLENRTVEVSQASVVLLSGASNAFGYVEFDLHPWGAGSYDVRCVLPSGWIATTSNPVSITLTSMLPTADTFFGQKRSRVCFRPASSWVHKVCWIAGRGVQITFHDRQRIPYLTVYYPGTTISDYDRFRVAGSAGRHVQAFYRPRPYIVVPLDP